VKSRLEITVSASENASSLRTAALIAALVGSAGSVALTLFAGRHNNSRILPLLFTFWVLSPFVLLIVAHLFSKRWPVVTRTALYGVMLVVTLGSLVIYARVALRPPKAQAASAFVIVPPASWALTAIVVAIAALLSSRQSRPK
jgi:hypothetical protein